MQTRTLNTLVGGALGDALGYPVEFIESGAVIVAAHGENAPARLLRCPDDAVHVSDDTQMTLFTVEGILRAREAGASLVGARDYVHAAYQRWLYTQSPSRFDRPEGGGLLDVAALSVKRAPGNTCLSALYENVQYARIPTLQSPPNHSKGCGAIMRAAPFGLAATSREEAFVASRDCGVLTHGHPSGYLSGAYFSSLIFDLARDVTLDDAMRSADALLLRESGHEEVAAALQTVRTLASTPSYAEIEAFPDGGWIGEWALAIAVACARHVDIAEAPDVARAMWAAAAHGGDSDSTASLAGSLLGAMGARFPTAWTDELELEDIIEGLSRRLDER